MGEAIKAQVPDKVEEKAPPKVGDERLELMYNIPGGAPVFDVLKWDGEKWIHSLYVVYDKKREKITPIY